MKFLKKHPVLYDKVSLETTPIQSELIATLSQERLDLAVCISICNEPYSLFLKTLRSALISISYMTRRFIGLKDQNIAIFLIQDGIQHISQQFHDDARNRILEPAHFSHIAKQCSIPHLIGLAGTYANSSVHPTDAIDDRLSDVPSEEVAVSECPGKKNIIITEQTLRKWELTHFLHCFYTKTREELFTQGQEELQAACGGRIPSCWLVYGVKEANSGKLDSHRCFFNGFCSKINPRYCLLVDCGTTFSQNAYFGFLQLGEVEDSVGGISSEIEAEWSWQPLGMAQYIEYKIDQILKAAEGLYGLVQILPGAHQFIKWKAIEGPPLQLYLEGTEIRTEPGKDSLGLFKRNVFLTEDKLMTALLMLRKDQSFTVEHLPWVKSFTDVPHSTAKLLRQRRRWLNGGFSTTLYGLGIYCKQARHSQLCHQRPCLSFLLFLQLFYYFLQIFVQGTIAAELATFFHFVTPFERRLRGHPFDPQAPAQFSYLVFLFALLTLGTLLLAIFGNSKSRAISFLYSLLTVLYAFMNVIKLVATVWVLVVTLQDPEIAPHLLFTQISMVAISLLFFFLNFGALILLRPGDFCRHWLKYLLSFVMYVLLAHTFRFMVKIYLVTNYHDVSWGSRGAPVSTRKKYKTCNAVIFLAWVLFHIFLLWMFLFAPFRYTLLAMMGLFVLTWNASRLVEAGMFWCCKWHCSLKYKVFGQLTRIQQIYRPFPEQRACFPEFSELSPSYQCHASRDETPDNISNPSINGIDAQLSGMALRLQLFEESAPATRPHPALDLQSAPYEDDAQEHALPRLGIPAKKGPQLQGPKGDDEPQDLELVNEEESEKEQEEEEEAQREVSSSQIDVREVHISTPESSVRKEHEESKDSLFPEEIQPSGGDTEVIEEETNTVLEESEPSSVATEVQSQDESSVE